MAKVVSLALERLKRGECKSPREVEAEFQRIRKTLQGSATKPVAQSEELEWHVLFAIQRVIEIALLDGDWHAARRKIADIRRRVHIRVVRVR